MAADAEPERAPLVRPEAVAAQFGRALREARHTAGLTQEQLGFRANIDRVYVSEIERGLKSPTVGVVCRLAWALRRNPSELLVRAENLARV